MGITFKSAVHAIVSGLLFLLPVIVMSGHAYTDLTIGAVLNGIYHWLVLYQTAPQSN